MSGIAGASSKKKEGKPAAGRAARRRVRLEGSQGARAAAECLDALPSDEKISPEEASPQRLVVHYSRDECLQFARLCDDPLRRDTLRQLVLIGQPASSLDGAAQLARITELWLVESQLEDVTAARECPMLEKLVLYANRIRDFPDLASLTRLTTLCLAGNLITSIKNASRLTALEDLNLADNLICSVSSGLRDCKRLAVLNLSGNPLASITLSSLQQACLQGGLSGSGNELLAAAAAAAVVANGFALRTAQECRHLASLQSLRTLTLADPVHGATPMTRLCNYRSCVLLHLQHLTMLDGFSVEPEELEQVRGFYTAKARHLSMLRRHAEARYVLGLRQLGKEAAGDLRRFRDHFFYLGQKQCERWHSRGGEQRPSSKPRGAQPTPEQDQKGPAVTAEELLKDLLLWEEDLQIKIGEQEAAYKMAFAQLECELENVGNVAVGVHEQGSQLATICQDLLDRLTCGAKLAKYGIAKTRVLRVTHVCSRGSEIVERWRQAETRDLGRERGQAQQDLQQGQQGLGHVWEVNKVSSVVSAVSSGSVEPSPVPQRGSNTCLGEVLEDADCDNMFLLLCNPSRDLAFGPWPFKVIDYPALGFVQELQEQPLVCNCVPLADSRWLRCRASGRLLGVRRLAPLVRLARGTSLRRARRVSEVKRPLSPRCTMYRVSGPRPELLFLVEFEYESEDAASASDARRRSRWRHDVPSSSSADRYPVLDESLLTYCIPTPSAGPGKLGKLDWTRLTQLNLAGRGIKVLGELPVLPNVVDLDLSYNQLGSLGSLYAFPNLRLLNLSFNDFTYLVNMRELTVLESLDLSWNNVRQLLVVLRTLSKYAPRLRSLQVAHNPIEDVLEASHGRHLAVKYLPQLVLLDTHPLRRDPEVLSRPTLGPSSRPQSAVPSTQRCSAAGRSAEELRLRWRADRGDDEGVLQVDKHTLSARGRRVTHIEDPESWLGSTRWADLSDNLLGMSSLGAGHCQDGQALGQLLAAMPHLHSLSLARNALEALPLIAFQRCASLRRLDLSGNYMQAASALATFSLPNLTILDMSGNHLQSLNGLETLHALVELYLANNRLRMLEDLQPLKGLHDVCVLDLTGNEVSSHANFKKFAVFHLRKLESVNGQAVVEGDVVAARETFGGCLDRDALLTQYAWKDLTHLVELTMPRSDLKKVELPGTLLPEIKFVDLSHNGLSCLWGLHDLPNLVTLNLGYNQVRELGGVSSFKIFPQLQTLFLNDNELTRLEPLALELASELRVLFLHQNQLSKLADLGAAALTGLVLDGNRLSGSAVQTAADAQLLLSAQELYLEGNQLDSLNFVANLKCLERLFVARNRISDAQELEHLRKVDHLRELSLLGNPVCIRRQHYAEVRELLPRLSLLDGHPMDQPTRSSDNFILIEKVGKRYLKAW